ncbi:aldose epimerase family protein [Neorhizobium sp. NCHU2750]|uniref:aldose epimerase family protein n=1 Tax=Neorhizobium sp. NCHU2750 TaxID=1825976 RepID=UPI000E722953|nr:aldose epimerase [Neorhizobium sp. NCHU2750]
MAGQALEIFGTTPEGEVVHRVRIAGGGLVAHVISWGAVIQDLRLEGHDAPLVLGFDDFASYLAHSPYFGATPGRCANRIGGGKFSIDGRDYQLELNERGITHLHGGSDGIAERNWMIVEHGADRVVLTITDPDGRAGYPGNCTISATYHLSGNGTLSVIYEAVSDEKTPANICQHSYFNLDGREDIFGHEIMIAADRLTEVDGNLVPTGRLTDLAGSPFDLRRMGPVKRSGADGLQVPFDHNYCLSAQRGAKRSVALVRSLYSGVSLEVRTTEPGVQFYAGVMVNVPVPGFDGRRYGPYAGFCLETQIWPDAINHENFPNAVLQTGEVLRQETDYVFSKS